MAMVEVLLTPEYEAQCCGACEMMVQLCDISSYPLSYARARLSYSRCFQWEIIGHLQGISYMIIVFVACN